MAEPCSMRYRMGLQVLCLSVCALLSMCVAASEQTEAASSVVPDVMPILEVTGKRASLASAQEIKKEKIEIVDSIVAEDIGKLPDISVADALSRVTGVQILRDRGEGSGIAIRGLTQMETLLNGREAFTAGNGRAVEFADIPSERLAGIDVYKTSSADHLEGGVGGTVDLRTNRPFDFKGGKLGGSLRYIYGDLVQQAEPQYSLLASSRWKTESQGEFGILLDAAYQKRAWREDQQSAGAPRSNLIAGVVVPNGISESNSIGQRERKSAGVVLEWVPQDNLQLYAEGHYAEFLTRQDTYQIYGSAPATYVAGSALLFPGTNDLQHITWNNATLTTVGAARDTQDRISQFAVGGTWSDAALTLKSDVSYTRSHNNLFYSTITLTGTAATLTQDLSSGAPTSSIGGNNLSSLANFNSAGMWYASRPFDGELKAVRLDGEYQLVGGVLDTLSAGLRVAARHASDAPGQVASYPTALVNNASGLVTLNPYAGYLVGDPAAARDILAARAALGITGALPTANPLGTWDIAEDTQAGYFMTKFHAASLPLEGNAGIRAVRTHEAVAGNRGPASGPYLPINLNATSNNYLPSANLRYTLASGLYLRGAASKTLTRQDFNQMSPSLTLNPVQLNGTGGNPELKPIRADNFDVSVERYFDATTSVYLASFYKRVDGFVVNVSSPETYDGITYQVTRPINGNVAHIKGLELGYQQFYDFLPDWLRGLGLQANYTYIDSATPSSVLGQDTSLVNLSTNSYNLIGLYERDKVSARLAYNWRSKFLSGIGNYVGVGAVPIYTQAYGWLDASLAYHLDKRTTLALEGSNLLRTKRVSYYGVETRPYSSYLNDRQLSLALMFSL